MKKKFLKAVKMRSKNFMKAALKNLYKMQNLLVKVSLVRHLLSAKKHFPPRKKSNSQRKSKKIMI